MRKMTLVIIAILIIACLPIKIPLQLTYLKRTILKTPLVKASPGWLEGYDYRRPITIEEQSGNTLTDYAVLIEYDFSTLINEGKIKSDLSDLRFADEAGNELPYFIFNRTGDVTKIYVKIPEIPASGSTTIYMYYGNPGASSPTYSPNDVVIFYDDFEDGVVGDEYVTFSVQSISEANGLLTMQKVYEAAAGGCYINTSRTYIDEASPPTNVWVLIETLGRQHETTDANSAWGIYYYFIDTDNMVYACKGDNELAGSYDFSIHEWSGGSESIISEAGSNVGTEWFLFKGIIFFNSTIKALASGAGESHELKKDLSVTKGYVGLHLGWKTDETFDFEYILVRQYIDPEPSYTIGKEEKFFAFYLPSNSLLLIHEITYSPNSTQFTHTFSATNTTTAGYETNYTNPYGWRVYANPFDSTENQAILISEVNISLPYSQVLVRNLTLEAKTNSTGDYRRLWIKVLDENGTIISELSNATIDTTWTTVTLDINTNMSNLLTLWINATVNSTTTSGEEIGIKDIRIYIEYETKPSFRVPLEANVPHFNCSSSHYVELGSSEYLNASTIIFKLIDHLTLNATDYPTSPTYIGNETINSYNYMAYKIDPANYSQSLYIYALLENKIETFDIKVKNIPITTVLVGEILTISLPIEGNITIGDIGEWTNVTEISFKLKKTGTFTIQANTTKISEWCVGYAKQTIEVNYGGFGVKLIDLDDKIIDYEDITLLLINKSSGKIVKELTGRKFLDLTTLWACNYTLRFEFKDIVLETRDFTLNSTTDNSVLEIQLNLRRRIEHYGNKWSIEPNATVTGAISMNLTRIDPENVEDRFSDFSIRYSWNDIYFNFNGTLISIVNGTPITNYTNRIMVLYPAQWGYAVLLWRQEGFIAMAVSHAWGENIVITAINGTFAIPKSILDYLPSYWIVESNGTETDTEWIISHGEYVHIWNNRYTKGNIEGLGFSNIPPYGHIKGMTILLNMTGEQVGQEYYIGTGIGADRIFYTTRDYLAVTAFKDDWDNDAWVYIVYGFSTRYFKRTYDTQEADCKHIFTLSPPPTPGFLSRIFPGYLDDPHTTTFQSPPEAIKIVLYEREGLYGVAISLEAYTTVPKEKKYDAWLFIEFKVENETTKTLNLTLGYIMKPVVDLTNYQQSGDTQGFSPYTNYGHTDIDFTLKEMYNGTWSTLADGSPYNYQDGYWAVWGEKTIGGTSYKTIIWFDKVFLGDKGSLTPQAVACYGYRIGLMVKEFDGTLSGGVEYGWISKFVISTEDVKRDLPSVQSSTDTNLVKSKLELGVNYPKIEYKPKIIVSDRPFNLVDLLPKLPMSRITIETDVGAKLILDYSLHPPTSFIIEGGKLISYSNGIAVIEAESNKINVTDLYKMNILIRDRLKRYLPIELYINTTKYKGYSISELFPVENYTIKIPNRWNGFEFYAYTDGYNETDRTITMDKSISFTIEYRVPTKMNITFVKTGETEDYVSGYFEVEVLDYYDEPVPNRNVTLILEWAGGTYRKIFTGMTDLHGVFTTTVVELYRDETYTVSGSFEGDDVYVGSTTQTGVQVAALPEEEEVVAPYGWEVYYIMFAFVGIIVVCIVILVALKLLRKSMVTRPRRYLRVGS